MANGWPGTGTGRAKDSWVGVVDTEKWFGMPMPPPEAPNNQFQFQLQIQLQQFLRSLQPVYCDTYLYCLPPSLPSLYLSSLSLCLSALTEINLILYAVAWLANEPQLQRSDLHTD